MSSLTISNFDRRHYVCGAFGEKATLMNGFLRKFLGNG